MMLAPEWPHDSSTSNGNTTVALQWRCDGGTSNSGTTVTTAQQWWQQDPRCNDGNDNVTGASSGGGSVDHTMVKAAVAAM